jgi:hypothetical protein
VTFSRQAYEDQAHENQADIEKLALRDSSALIKLA